MLRQTIRYRVITLTVIERMVIHVMRRDPRKGREAIEYREPVIREGVEGLVTPNRQVIVIVSNHRHSYAEKKVKDVERPGEPDDRPLKYEYCRRDGHVDERSNVS